MLSANCSSFVLPSGTFLDELIIFKSSLGFSSLTSMGLYGSLANDCAPDVMLSRLKVWLIRGGWDPFSDVNRSRLVFAILVLGTTFETPCFGGWLSTLAWGASTIGRKSN